MFTVLYFINIWFVHFSFSPGSERKGVRKCAKGVEAGLLIHLPSGAETQLWMHKRPWPEGKAKANWAVTIYCRWLVTYFNSGLIVVFA